MTVPEIVIVTTADPDAALVAHLQWPAEEAAAFFRDQISQRPVLMAPRRFLAEMNKLSPPYYRGTDVVDGSRTWITVDADALKYYLEEQRRMYASFVTVRINLDTGRVTTTGTRSQRRACDCRGR